jgi:hypothetical protein
MSRTQGEENNDLLRKSATSELEMNFPADIKEQGHVKPKL